MENPSDRAQRLEATIYEINREEQARQRAYILGITVEQLPATEDKLPQTAINLQIKALIVAKCYEELGMTEEEYRNSLAALSIRPSPENEKFPLPILVEPRVSIERQIQGMDNDLNDDPVEKMTNRESIFVPALPSREAKPYIIWVNDGTLTRNMTIQEVLTYFQQQDPPQRGLTFLELLAFRRANVGAFFRGRPTYNMSNVFPWASAQGSSEFQHLLIPLG